MLFSIPVLFIASILIFVVAKKTASPLGALRFNPRIRPEDVKRFKHDLGLDKSGYEQYTAWLGHFLRGNWGESLVSNKPVWPEIRDALGNTLVLGIFATVISLTVGVAIGVISSVRQYSAFDYIATGGAFFGLSIPVFWFALIVQLVFAVYFVDWFHLKGPIFYTSGMFKPGTTGYDVTDRLRHIALPALVLCVQTVAVYSRYMRASMLEVLGSDYLRTA